MLLDLDTQMDFCKHVKPIADENALEFEVFNPEENSTLKNMITSSGTQFLDSAIEDVRNNKKTMVLLSDLVMRLMKDVECEEKAAEEAKEEAGRNSLDILATVDEVKQAQQYAKEKNVMHARELYAQKACLATEVKGIQNRLSSLLDDGDRSLLVLDEMRNNLELRLITALIKKEFAVKEKLELETLCGEELAYQESQMEEVVEELKRLQQEAIDIFKFQEILKDRRDVVNMLHGEMFNKRAEVNLLKKEFEQSILQRSFQIKFIELVDSIVMKNLNNKAMKNLTEQLLIDITDYCSDEFDDGFLDVADYEQDDSDKGFVDAVTDYDCDEIFMDADCELDDFEKSFMDAVTGNGQDYYDDI